VHMWSIRSYLFFFQAEDGIRDWSVTGVQTCALPIFQKSPNLSAEDLGSPRWRHYWDDLWAISGYREAAFAASELGFLDDASAFKIGRASCRERGEISGVAVAVKKNSGGQQ